MRGWFTTLLNCAFPASNFPSQLISLSFLGGSLQGSRKKRCLWHPARLGGEVLQIWERHRVLWSLTAGKMSYFQETSPVGRWQKSKKSWTMVHLQVQKFLKVEQGTGARVAAVGKCVWPRAAGDPSKTDAFDRRVSPKLWTRETSAPCPPASGDQEWRNNGFELSSREEN